PPTTESFPLSLHDALPISQCRRALFQQPLTVARDRDALRRARPQLPDRCPSRRDADLGQDQPRSALVCGGGRLSAKSDDRRVGLVPAEQYQVPETRALARGVDQPVRTEFEETVAHRPRRWRSSGGGDVLPG